MAETQINVGMNVDGVITGTEKAKRKISELGGAARDAGNEAAKGMTSIGNGGEAAAKKVAAATQKTINSIQRQIAAFEAGDKSSRKYQESLAKMRGIDVAALRPYLDQLDAAKAKQLAATASQESMSIGFGSIKVGAFAAAAAIGAFAAAFKNIVNGVDALNDLKDATGASIENISALEDIALRTGTSFDTVAAALIKFNGVLKDNKAGTATAEAFRAIGVSVEDLKALDPALALQKVAKAFAGFADDGNKARIMQELFGKSTRQVAALMKDLAEQGKLVGTVTTEETDEAEKLNKEFSTMSKNVTDLARDIAGPLVTAFNEFIKKQREAREAGKFGLFTTIADMERAEAARKSKNYEGSFYVGNGGRGNVNPALVRPALPDLPDPAAIKAAASAAQKALDEQNRALADQAKLLAELSGMSGSFQKDWADLAAIYQRGEMSLEQLEQAQAKLLAKQPIIAEGLRAEEEAIKATAKARLDAITVLQKETETTAQQLAKQLEHNATIGLSAQAIAELEAANMNLQATELERKASLQDGIMWDTATTDEYKRQAQALRDLAAAKVAGAQKQAGVDAAKDMAAEQKKAAEESSKYWTDALMRAFESGKSFFASLWETIKNTLKTQVLKVLVSATGLTGMSAAGAGDLAGGGGNLLGTASTLRNMYDSITGGFTKLTATVSGNLQYAADWMMTSQSDLVASLGESLSGSVGTLSSIAGYAAGAAAGLAIGKAISGGYGSNTAVNAGTAIGAVVGGPIGAAIGGAIGGLVNRAFGRGPTQLTSSGTRGTFSGDEFSGVNYANYKKDGGWFRSDKNWTDITSMATATRDAWSYAFAGVKGSVEGMAASLGLATDKITAYSKYVDIAAGTTEAQLTAIFTSMADDMATAAAPGIAQFAKSGETASAVLARLSGSLGTANAWLSMLRNRLFDVSLSGADAASKLADAFGSLDNLAASSKAYYDLFYTEAERTAKTTEDLAKAMALIGVATIDTKAAFKEVVSGLDLNTEAGRNAYAVLLALAPEFAATASTIDKMATETATALLKTFTGDNQLLPALDAAALSVGNFAGSAVIMSGELTFINTIMGDATSAVIGFSDGAYVLGTAMTESQTSAALLQDQIDALAQTTDKTRIDFEGLGVALLGVDPSLVGTSIEDANRYLSGIDPLPVSVSMADVNAYLKAINTLPVGASVDQINEALKGVNTETFVATLALVFENLADRIGSVIANISAERMAVREAALQIINPTVMSKAQIERGIAGIGTALPSNAGVVTANTTLANADALYASTQGKLDAALGYNAAYADTQKAAAALPDFYKQKFNEFVSLQAAYGVYANATAGPISYNRDAYAYNESTNRLNGYGQITYDSNANIGGFKAADDALVGILSQANTKLAESEATLAAARANAVADLTPYTTALTAAQAVQTTAATAAKQAALDYTKALQTFAIDAGQSVTKLARLREETVKYYQAQKELADLMGTSAASLRTTVANYRFGQMDDEQKYQSLAAQFSAAYTSSQGAGGESLAGYGDQINALINPLIESLNATGRGGLIASYLAQAEAVAGLLETSAPANYQADSLAMLGSIDATLASLQDASLSAERIIADAVDAGAERTADGLRAVIAALTGQAIPAFASGGAYGGGLALVGEQGPELINFNQPGQIYTANQTQGLLGGNTARLEALVERQSKQLEAMSFELRAIATSSNKTAKTLERVTPDGNSLQTVAAT